MNYNPNELISCFLVTPASMTPEQGEQLSQWIKQDIANARDFVQSSLLHWETRDYFCQTNIMHQILFDKKNAGSPEVKSGFEEEFWEQLSYEEQNAPCVEIIKKEEEDIHSSSKSQEVKHPRISSSRGAMWFSLASIAATILLFVYVFTHPRYIPCDIATLVDEYQAQWEGSEFVLQKGTRLFNDRIPLRLTKGYAKIQFDNGVKIAIEAPAEFVIEDYERMTLLSGQLYAKAPRQVIGFRVNTPNCSVIDLGTEFGVKVKPGSDTDVHLFKGKASLMTVSHGQVRQSHILQPQEAKSVNDLRQIRSIPFQENAFIRDFDSEKAVLWNGEVLSLADIVSGGNGFGTASSNTGIELKTGKLIAENRESRGRGPTGYIPVPELPFVDGVFVPDGGNGPVRITSQGHAYDGFGDTNGFYYMAIGAYKFVDMYFTGKNEWLHDKLLSLEGYSRDNSANLCLHANAGITFDLQKIRQAIPFVKLKQFTAVCGVAKTKPDITGVTSDFYVLVDGQPRQVKKSISVEDEPVDISVPLHEEDCFLTLVCTEGADGNYGDWSLFVNPALELEPKD